MIDGRVLSLPDLDPIFAAELARRAQLRAKEDREQVLKENETLAGFVKNAWHVLEPTQPYVHGWHIDAMCAALTSVTDGWIKRLLINVPPGTMKSLLVSVLWPAWEWGPRAMPHLRYLATSYEQELVLRDNLRMRRLIESEWYQSLYGDKVRLAADQRAKGKFQNTATGEREGRAFSSMTGGRGDRVIIDDPHSVKTAESDAVREDVTTTFREAIPTRLNNPDSSAIVIVMQRLHQEDVSGVALKMEQGYVHLRLPMLYEAENPCTIRLGPGMTFTDPRKVDGELLFEQRFPKVVVQALARVMGPYATAGQMQQRPSPREGGLFKVDNIEIVGALPPLVKIVRGWDFASTKKKQGSGDPDWTVGLKMGKGTDGTYYILDVARFRETPGVVKQKVQAISSQDGTGTYIRLPQDPGQAGKAQAESYVSALAGYMVKALPVTGDKELRATPFASQVDIGNVKMLRGPWNDVLLAEMRSFPAGTHDDQCDAGADAFNEIAGIVPGEGLLEYYRQEAERAAAEARGANPLPPGFSGPEGRIGLIPPPGCQMAFGRQGEMYRLDADGVMWVTPDDVFLARAVGWITLTPDLEGS